MRTWTCLPLVAALGLACQGGDSGSATATTTATAGFTSTMGTTGASATTEESASASASTEGESEGATTTTSGTTGESTSEATTSSSTTRATTDDSTSEVSASESGTTGEPCDPEADICCLMEGQIPPHELLDTFLAVYPPANMPKTVADVQAFEPVADGHAMAWSDENVGNELVDANNGGVIEANIVAGRTISRDAAMAALPPGAVIVSMRDDPVIIEDLGGNSPCIGVGWAWGSILFEAVDTSIGEVVYLYVGYCNDGDVEAFYYSDQAVEICPPIPG
ncbi:MAG: hypothetical protein R3B09_13580 [Nannocystaceae bacterium]